MIRVVKGLIVDLNKPELDPIFPNMLYLEASYRAIFNVYNMDAITKNLSIQCS